MICMQSIERVFNCHTVRKSVETARPNFPLSPMRKARLNGDVLSESVVLDRFVLKPGPSGPWCSERSAARLAHQSGGLGVAGSNPAAPTNPFNNLAEIFQAKSFHKDRMARLWKDCNRCRKSGSLAQHPAPALLARLQRFSDDVPDSNSTAACSQTLAIFKYIWRSPSVAAAAASAL